MARVSTYLNFARSTEAAFLFYKSVFKTEFTDSIKRFKGRPLRHSLDVQLSEQDLKGRT